MFKGTKGRSYAYRVICNCLPLLTCIRSRVTSPNSIPLDFCLDFATAVTIFAGLLSVVISHARSIGLYGQNGGSRGGWGSSSATMALLLAAFSLTQLTFATSTTHQLGPSVYRFAISRQGVPLHRLTDRTAKRTLFSARAHGFDDKSKSLRTDGSSKIITATRHPNIRTRAILDVMLTIIVVRVVVE